MENASKALLIAAAVLIVVLLIAFGMKIFNSTSGSADEIEGTMQTTEISMFNEKFAAYYGKNKSKSDVNSLVNKVIASNASTNKIITMTIVGSTSGTPTFLSEYVSNLSSTDKYEIKAAQFDDNGYVNKIDVIKMP